MAKRFFIDYNQNGPRPDHRLRLLRYGLNALGPPSSTPVTWAELTEVEPDDFDLAGNGA